MNINLTYDPGTSLNQILTFEVAAKVWEKYFSDDVDINLHVGVTDSSNLPGKVIGGALPAMSAGRNFAFTRSKIQKDATSALDRKAIKHISGNTTKFKHEKFHQPHHQVENDLSQNQTSKKINMTTANAKALGLSVAANRLDGYIVLSNLRNQGVDWDTTSDTAAGGRLDLVSTAMHEIGHALGFVSGVDQPGAQAAVVNNANSSIANRVKHATVLDLFRYSAQGTRNITYGSERSDKYFSIDGGKTSLAKFSSGADRHKGGDGFQASHWKKRGSVAGVMDPTLRKGQRSKIKELDLKAFDAIGWDRNGVGANAAINFIQLRQEAQTELSQRAGKSWEWMHQHKSQAASLLSEVRIADIVKMVVSSQVYDLSWMNQYGGASYFLNWAQSAGGQSFWLNWWNNGGGDAWWQAMDHVFEQQGLFSTLNEVEGLDGMPTSGNAQDIDSLTGQSLAQTDSGLVPNAVFSPTAQAPQLKQVEAFTAVQDPITGHSAAENSLQMSYNNMDSLSLGSHRSGNLLSGHLTGLVQDPLQGVVSLGDALTTGLGMTN